MSYCQIQKKLSYIQYVPTQLCNISCQLPASLPTEVDKRVKSLRYIPPLFLTAINDPRSFIIRAVKCVMAYRNRISGVSCSRLKNRRTIRSQTYLQKHQIIVLVASVVVIMREHFLDHNFSCRRFFSFQGMHSKTHFSWLIASFKPADVPRS